MKWRKRYKNKLLYFLLSSYLVFNIIILTNTKFKLELDQNNLVLDNNKAANLATENNVVDYNNQYLLKFKANNNLNSSVNSSGGPLLDSTILEPNTAQYSPNSTTPTKKAIVIDINYLNKYNIAVEKFLNSITFGIQGFMIDSNLINNSTKYVNINLNDTHKNNKIPYTTSSFFISDDTRIEREKTIALIIEKHFENNKLYLIPSISATNNPDYTIETNNPDYTIAANQEFYLTLSSPYIWEKNNILMDQYVSSKFKLISTGNKDFISSGVTGPNIPTSNNSYTYYDSTNTNTSGGTLVNKINGNISNNDILVDLSNIYYDDNWAIKNKKSFNIILNNFIVSYMQIGKKTIPINKETNFPISFSIDYQDYMKASIEKNFYFYGDKNSDYIKATIKLEQKEKLKFLIKEITFSLGPLNTSKEMKFQWTSAPNSYLSVLVKASDFSIFEAQSEIKNIANTETKIISEYSSDVFENSIINDSSDVFKNSIINKSTNTNNNTNNNMIISNFDQVKTELNNKLKKLITKSGGVFKAMGAQANVFNIPIYSFDYFSSNDHSKGYGILKIATNQANKLLEKIEIKAKFVVVKNTVNETIKIKLATNEQNQQILGAEATELKTLNPKFDLADFINHLNNKTTIEKQKYFQAFLPQGINFLTAIKKISFKSYYKTEVLQKNSLEIVLDLNPDYWWVDSQGKFKKQAIIIAENLDLKYAKKQIVKVDIDYDKLGQKAQNYPSFSEFKKNTTNISSYYSAVWADDLTSAQSVIKKSFFEVDNNNKNGFLVKIVLDQNYNFDNDRNEKNFSIGNIAWSGNPFIPSIIDPQFDYFEFAKYAQRYKDQEELVAKFNASNQYLLEKFFGSEYKSKIVSLKLEITGESNFLILKIKAANNYCFLNTSKFANEKTFFIINIKYLEDNNFKSEQMDLTINQSNLINLIKNYQFLDAFVNENKDQFLIKNNNSDSIINFSPYYSEAIVNWKVFVNEKENIEINLQIKNGYSLNVKLSNFDEYHSDLNPYFKIIISQDDIKKYYQNSNNTNSNSTEVQFQLDQMSLKFKAKEFLNIDSFIAYLNQSSNSKKWPNIFEYIDVKLGSLHAIKAANVIKTDGKNNSLTVQINLKENYYFFGENIDLKTINLDLSDLSFKEPNNNENENNNGNNENENNNGNNENEDNNGNNENENNNGNNENENNNNNNGGDNNNSDETQEFSVDIRVNNELLAAKAKKVLNFSALKKSLDTFEKKLELLTFVKGDKNAIWKIELRQGLNSKTIIVSIYLNDGFSFQGLGKKEFIVGNIAYKNDPEIVLEALKIKIKGNKFLKFANAFPNFSALRAILDNKEKILEFIDINSKDINKIAKIFIFKGDFRNEIYLQVYLNNGFYFEGESKYQISKNFLFSNVYYSKDKNIKMTKIKKQINWARLFQLLENYNSQSIKNFAKQNYQNLFAFNSNNGILKILPLDIKILQSAILFNNSEGIYIEIKVKNGYYFDESDYSNTFFRKFISYQDIKPKYKVFAEEQKRLASQRQNTIVGFSVAGSILFLILVSIPIIVHIHRKRKWKKERDV